MDTNADRRARRSAPYEDAQYDADDAPALDGLVGAALAMSAAALVLAALAHTTALTLGPTTRAVAITVAIVLGAVAGWVDHRLRHHGAPVDRLRPRSVR